MSITKVDGWQTSDNKMFNDALSAKKHEDHLDTRVELIGYARDQGMFSNGAHWSSEHWINFIMSNRESLSNILRKPPWT